MSEKLAELKKSGSSGGSLSETVLWSNSLPTADWPDTTVTLSSNISEYKFIKIVFNATTSDTTQSWIIYDSAIFPTMHYSASEWTMYAIMWRRRGGTTYSREIEYKADNQIYISRSNAQNSQLIPVQIIGMK